MLFKKKPDEFRCAVRYAARRAGIDHCTPNDLRRTYSTWLRAAGAHLDTIAPTMGHADTRMLQRTYARLRRTCSRRGSPLKWLGHRLDRPECTACYQ